MGGFNAHHQRLHSPGWREPGRWKRERAVLQREYWCPGGRLSDQRLAIYSFADLSDATRLEAVGGVNVEYPKMVDADIVRPAATPSGSADGK